MKAIIIDDEPLACNLISEFISDFPEIHVIAICHDGFEGLKQISEHQPDLIFLDVQMPKINGFEMLELLEQSPAVIFTTAFDEYAISAFENNAVDYLLKPFSKERFNKAVNKFIELKSSQIELENFKSNQSNLKNNTLDKIVIKENADIKIIPLKNIIFIESYDDYVKIHTLDKIYIKKNTMNFYESSLESKGFIRIHRSYIVNIDHVKSIENEQNTYLVVLSNTAKLSPSRSGLSLLKNQLNY